MVLDGNIINGFSTLASIIIDENKKDVNLAEVTIFSNAQEEFVSQEELRLYNKKKIEDEARVAKIKELIAKNEHINMTLSLMRQSKRVSETVKVANLGCRKTPI